MSSGDSGADDLLGSLPDPILHQILSHLPTKLVVQTSVLSTRWRHLWRAAADLSFDEEDFLGCPAEEPVDALANLVEAVLLLRDRSVPVRRFGLRCGNWIHQRRVATWIRAAVGEGDTLRALDVSLPGGFDLPPAVFSCASLQELALRMKYWDIALPRRGGSAVRLDRLCVLRVFDADFLNAENERRLGELISACPNLVELTIDSCYFTSLHIHAAQLERLTFHHYDFNDVSVSLSTPRLRYLDHVCEGIEDFSPGELPDLVEGSFDFSCYTRACDVGRTIDALRGLSNAKALTLLDFVILFPPYNEELIGRLPVFGSLRDLKLNYSVEEIDYLLSIRCLLQCTPDLETLTIEDLAPSSILNADGRSLKREVLPLDCLNRIKDTEIGHLINSSGCQYDIVRVTFMNENPLENI